MSLGDWGDIASAGAAWLALVLAGISLYKNHRSEKRQDELAETTKELNRLLIERETKAGQESKRADLSANLIAVGKNNWHLKVFNKGKGTARNVRLIDLQGEDSLLDEWDIRQKFPLPILEQHQSVEVLAAVLLKGPRRGHVKLVWDDEVGTDHYKELTPSV
jgi:hypothetical protein